MKKVLLGTTGLIAASAIAGSAFAGEITLPGALDLRISGTNDFEVEYAAEDVNGFAQGSSREGRTTFFNQDHEIIFRFTGVGDSTGLTYGANLELELQDATNANWDEAWGFVRGGFGEFRMGNEDTALDILKIGGHFNNRGTGGLDGAQRTAQPIRPVDSGEATKIIYFTPQITGFQAGVDYAINAGDSGFRVGTVNEAQDMWTASANWLGSAFGLDLGAFAGLSSFTPPAIAGNDRTYNYMVGGLIGAYGVSLAVGYIDNDDDAIALDGIDYSINAGLAGELAGVGLSFAFQQNELVGELGDEQYYVVSADTAILPGVALRGDLAYQDGDDNNSGINGILQLRTAW